MKHLKNMKMIKEIYLYWLRNCCILTNEKAQKLNLTHYKNNHGDEINTYGFRSFWQDDKKRLYCVKNLG